MSEAQRNEDPLDKLVRRMPWANWSFLPWLRYTLTWKGWRATMRDNPPPVPGVRGWKLHRCADGEQCRASIGGGCADGWCGHYEVRPDEVGIPRFPRSRVVTPNAALTGDGPADRRPG